MPFVQGVGTHHLRMSDLSAFFHLSVVDAAKKLGVSQTTLKKACRKFGLKRWPGRKVIYLPLGTKPVACFRTLRYPKTVSRISWSGDLICNATLRCEAWKVRYMD